MGEEEEAKIPFDALLEQTQLRRLWGIAQCALWKKGSVQTRSKFIG